MNPELVLDDVRIMSLKGSSVGSYRGRVNAYLPYDAWLEVEDEDFLYDVNITHRNRHGRKRCTLAGLLMLGEESEISAELPRYLLQYTEYDAYGNTMQHFTSKEAGAPENLYDFYREVSERITAGIKPSFLLTADYDKENSSIHRSLRELLAMALISADFDLPGGVDVMRTPTVVSLSFPGRAGEGMVHPLQSATKLGMSNTLVKLFNLFGVLEPRVTHSKDVPEVWSKQGWKAPIVTVQESPARVTATFPLK